jgi:hypothetical protein
MREVWVSAGFWPSLPTNASQSPPTMITDDPVPRIIVRPFPYHDDVMPLQFLALLRTALITPVVDVVERLTAPFAESTLRPRLTSHCCLSLLGRW